MRQAYIIVACLFLASAVAREAETSGIADPFPKVASSYLVKVNGKTVWAHNPDRRLSPASLTKIMTALLVLERGKMDEVVIINKSASEETGSRIGLKKGDKMRVGYLLAAALIVSANDACRALAEHIGGSETRFVSLMNRKAKHLGMKNTHFTNACGHDHPEHYSTAHDLIMLTETALKNHIFSELVKVIDAYITTLDGRQFYLENKNALIGRYGGAIGIKTGYTRKAEKCLIALAERDGVKVLLILLNASDRWWDAEAILDKAFLYAASKWQ